VKKHPEHELTRLSDEAATREQELLRSAGNDRSAPGVLPAALAAVLAAHRREVAERRMRWGLAVAATISLAAAGLLLASGTRAPKLSAERSSPSQARSAAPAPSASTVPAPPFVPCSPPSVGSGHEPMIDDFEDGDTRMLLVDKRAGYWIAFNDGTGKQEPRVGSVFPANRIPGGRGASRFGLRTTGTRFSKWGAVLAAELNPRRCYDASAYGGLAFWARGHGTVRVVAKMTQVVAEEFGGSCVKDCYDGHGAIRVLTREWARHVVAWDELRQRGFGAAVRFDPRSLYSIEFALPEGQPPFELWLDDVAFLSR
jgi:hypothetical protein